jgi:hypothetical protein
MERIMKARPMIAVISNKNKFKVESYWNTEAEAKTHIKRFGMKNDYHTATRLVYDAPAYAGPERRKSKTALVEQGG